MRTLLFLSAIATLSACDDTGTPATGSVNASRASVAIEQSTSVGHLVGGCGDIYIAASDANDENAVFLHIDDSLAWDAATDSQSRDALPEPTIVPLTRTYTLPHPAVTVSAKWGTDLTLEHCNDVIDSNRRPVIDGELDAVQGTLTITVTPSGGPVTEWDFSGRADVDVTGLQFDQQPDNPAPPIDFTLDDVLVGWFPG